MKSIKEHAMEGATNGRAPNSDGRLKPPGSACKLSVDAIVERHQSHVHPACRENFNIVCNKGHSKEGSPPKCELVNY